MPFWQISLKNRELKTTHDYLSGLSRVLFPTTFLEKAVNARLSWLGWEGDPLSRNTFSPYKRGLKTTETTAAAAAAASKTKTKTWGHKASYWTCRFLTYFGVDPGTSFPWTLVHLSIRAVETDVPFQLQVKSMTSIVIVQHVIVQ